MADKFLNLTAVQTIKTWIDGKFSTKTELDALETKVDEIIAEGGEPNVIETVKVNGTALTPDAQKAVNVKTLEMSFSMGGGVTIADQEGGSIEFHTDTQDSEIFKINAHSLATTGYVANNGGKIQKVKYDGTELPIDTTDKSVNVPKEIFIAVQDSTTYTELAQAINDEKTIIIKSGQYMQTVISSYLGATSQGSACQLYTLERNLSYKYEIKQSNNSWTKQEFAGFASSVSELENDGDGTSPFATQLEVQSAISTAVASAYKYKGSVATQSALPSSGNTTGDVWDVQDTGINYAWTGTAWDALGSYVDTSVLWTSTTGQTNTLEAATVAEINAILNA